MSDTHGGGDKEPVEGQPGSPLKSQLAVPGIKQVLLSRFAAFSADTPKRLAKALFGPLSESAGQEKRGKVVEFLKQVTLFEDLGRMDLQRLARIVHEREYSDGEYISREERPGAALFILRRGLVEITRRDRDGTDVTLATLEPPATFEESAAMGTVTIRRFSTRARGPVSLLALGRSDLDALCDNFPPLANKVLMRLAAFMAVRLEMLADAQFLGESREAEEPEEPKP